MSRHTLHSLWPWLVLGFILVSAAGIRVRLLNVPLERDEGEYAYAGQLLLQGVPPWRDAYNMKLPGAYLAYAAIMGVGGQTVSAIHAGLLLVNGATTVFIFLIARRLIGGLGAVAAAAVFALLSLSQGLFGFTANAEPFVILPAVAGIDVLLRAMDSRRVLTLAAGGVLLGVAFLMKQHAAAFMAYGFVALAWCEFRRKPVSGKITFLRLGVFCLAGAVPLAAVVIWLAAAGVFVNFWYWTVDYALFYGRFANRSQGVALLSHSVNRIFFDQPWLWSLAALGLPLLLLLRSPGSDSRRLIGLFVFFSCLAVCPGFLFREHYFILLLPAAALLAGVAVQAIAQLLGRLALEQREAGAGGTPGGSGGVRRYWPCMLATTVLIAALAASIGARDYYLFRVTAHQVSVFNYPRSPFAISAQIAGFLDAHTRPDESIAILGSEPQILFLARRRSATPYIYVYPLVEPQPDAEKMQEKMVAGLEKSRPRIVVYAAGHDSWLRQPGPTEPLGRWMAEELPGRFHFLAQYNIYRTGRMDFLSPAETRGYFDRVEAKEIPAADAYVSIFERNP